MQIDPVLQGKLYVFSLFLGLSLGLLQDAASLLQVLVGAYPRPPSRKELYERRLPWLGRAVGYSAGKVRLLWQRLFGALWHLLLPLVGALAILVLCFGYNSGAFRLPVFLLAALGFFLWRRLASARLLRGFEMLSYLLSAFLLYIRALLLLPLRLCCHLFLRLCWWPLFRGLRQCRHRWLLQISQRLCKMQLQAAADGILAVNVKRKRSILKRKRNVKRCHTIKKEAAPRPSRF